MATCEWVIDIIQEWANARFLQPPCFIDRGDPAAVDYVAANFTRDSTWRELDLSAIVPEGASAVSLILVFDHGGIGKHAYFRKHSNANAIIFTGVHNHVIGVSRIGDLTVAVDSDRKIDYNITAGLGMTVDLSVKGWWL